MDERKYISIGKILKIHGFDGAVMVKTESKFSGRIKESEPVFLIVEGKPVPFFIETAEQFRPGSMLIKFDGYDSPASVNEFTGCEITMPVDSDIPPELTDRDDLKGFRIFSSEGREIGTITGLINKPGQYLLKIISTDKNEILIPLHEDLIVSIDPDSMSVTMTIPDGLIELNR